MKKIEVILKVTEKCNLRCKYCYNGQSAYGEQCLSLERFEKLLRVLLKGYNLIHIIWHGGEPLSAGIQYFRAAMDVERRLKIETGVVIENSVQTNGTLVNGEWINFFKENDFRVGVSFDGVDNEKYRQETQKALLAMDKMQAAGIKFGCNAVVADDEYDLTKNYLFFKEKGLSFDFSSVIAEGGAKNMPSPAAVRYADGLCDLFDKWLYDTDGVSVRTFALYLNMAAGGKYRICTCASCHLKYLCITPDGTVYNCARASMKDYPFGNIDDLSDVDGIFGSEGAKKLISGSVERRKKCKQSCEYFSLCAGGCADIAAAQGDLTTAPADYCHTFKKLFKHIKTAYDKIVTENIPLSQLNPAVKQIFARSLSKMNMSTKNALSDTYL